MVILETKRLELRKWTNADCEALWDMLQDRKVVRDIDNGEPFSIEKTREFLERMEQSDRENGFARWKVIERSSGEIAGSCGFGLIYQTGESELGYLFAREHWGKGFATEIARAAVVYGFNKLNFREIIALTAPENSASQNVLRKIGFKERGLEIYKGEENLVFSVKK